MAQLGPIAYSKDILDDPKNAGKFVANLKEGTWTANGNIVDKMNNVVLNKGGVMSANPAAPAADPAAAAAAAAAAADPAGAPVRAVYDIKAGITNAMPSADALKAAATQGEKPFEEAMSTLRGEINSKLNKIGQTFVDLDEDQAAINVTLMKVMAKMITMAGWIKSKGDVIGASGKAVEYWKAMYMTTLTAIKDKLETITIPAVLRKEMIDNLWIAMDKITEAGMNDNSKDQFNAIKTFLQEPAQGQAAVQGQAPVQGQLTQAQIDANRDAVQIDDGTVVKVIHAKGAGVPFKFGSKNGKLIITDIQYTQPYTAGLKNGQEVKQIDGANAPTPINKPAQADQVLVNLLRDNDDLRLQMGKIPTGGGGKRTKRKRSKKPKKSKKKRRHRYKFRKSSKKMRAKRTRTR